MTAYEFKYRARSLGAQRPTAWAFAAFAAAWTVAAAYVLMDHRRLYLYAVIAAPLAVAGALLLVGSDRKVPIVRGALGWTLTGALAIGGAVVIAAVPLAAAAVPVIGLAAWVTTRFPVASIFVLFVLTGFFGTLAAYFGFSAPIAADLILGGLWLGAIWSRLAHPGQRPVWMWPATAVLALYLALTLLSVLLSPDLVLALRAFRVSAWYMMAFLLVAYAPWTDRERRLRMAHGVVVVTLLVGSYATFRYFAGQTPTEVAYALAQGTNTVDGNVRLVGSFSAGRMLAIWTATAIPFCLAVALASRRRWRLLGLTASISCVLPLYATFVRAGLIAVTGGLLLVLGLYQFARAFPGLLRIGSGVALLVVIGVIGVAGFKLAFRDKPGPAHRYGTLVTSPRQDEAVNARLLKWRDARDDIRDHPVGQGVGTHSKIHKRFGRFMNISNFEVDNSFLTIALEQGVAVLVLFLVALASLLVGLARRAIVSSDPQDAALAMGAAGVLMTMTIFAVSVESLAGLPALAGWLMVGLGAAPFVSRAASRATVPRRR